MLIFEALHFNMRNVKYAIVTISSLSYAEQGQTMFGGANYLFKKRRLQFVKGTYYFAKKNKHRCKKHYFKLMPNDQIMLRHSQADALKWLKLCLHVGSLLNFAGLTVHVQRGSLDEFADTCISLLGNHVLACISIVGVKKLVIFVHKTIALLPTDQMHPKLKSPSIS